MNNIDFQNGFALGLTLAYKKMAEGQMLGNFIIRQVSDTVTLQSISLNDSVSMNMDSLFRNNTADTLGITVITMTDDVTVTLI